VKGQISERRINCPHICTSVLPTNVMFNPMKIHERFDTRVYPPVLNLSQTCHQFRPATILKQLDLLLSMTDERYRARIGDDDSHIT
jgi:hypothetical protein